MKDKEFYFLMGFFTAATLALITLAIISI